MRAVNEPVFLIFHDSSQDLKYLRSVKIQAPIEDLQILMPDDLSTATDGLYTFDTADIYAALEGRSSGNKPGLNTVVNQLQLRNNLPDGIPRGAPLHNAGNDAEFTLLALKSMAAGEQVDAQRQTRWPNLTPASYGNAAGDVPAEESDDESDNDWYD